MRVQNIDSGGGKLFTSEVNVVGHVSNTSKEGVAELVPIGVRRLEEVKDTVSEIVKTERWTNSWFVSFGITDDEAAVKAFLSEPSCGCAALAWSRGVLNRGVSVGRRAFNSCGACLGRISDFTNNSTLGGGVSGWRRSGHSGEELLDTRDGVKSTPLKEILSLAYLIYSINMSLSVN
jgi:hypothetical protein